MQNQQEQASHFIGRERELAIFRSWLQNSSLDESSWILYIYDALEDTTKKGGVGKTWLLQQYEQIARQIHPDLVIVRIDFFNINDRPGPAIGDRIFQALKQAYPDWTPKEYPREVPAYLSTIRSGKEATDEVRSRLADALLADLSTLEETLQEDRKYLLVVFDTYEQIEQNPSIAVLRSSQSFPDNYNFERIGVVVAGRNPLDWTQPNWRDRKGEVFEIALAPFNEVEMVQYFEQLSTVNQAILQEYMPILYERTEGRPILVGLVTDVLNRRIISVPELASSSFANFEASLVAKINDFERPFDIILLYMAHVYHRFNFDILHWILDRSNMQGILNNMDDATLRRQLLQLSFVRRPSTIGDDFVLHDEMRPLITRYCWEQLDPDKRSRKEISAHVIAYYTEKLKPHDLSEQLRQAYTVERLYHELFLDINRGYAFFEENFAQAILLWLSAFARSLLQETQKFASELSQEQRYMLKRYEAQLLQKEEKAEQALALYDQLENEADPAWIAAQGTAIIYEQGVCYQQLSRFPEAIDCFNKVKDLEQAQGNDSDYASMLNWLGSTYLRQGQLETALRYFEESITIHKRVGNQRSYPSVLNSIGNTYRLQGKIDEALTRTKIAWRLRNDLFKEGKVSEIFVGWSLSAIGTIYMDNNDLVKAEKNFQEAYDIFTRIGSKKGLATMYNRFGQLSGLRGELDEAMNWHKKAYINAIGGIDVESQINSLNKQGALLVQQKQWEQAEKTLTRASELAEITHDYYQQTESLIDLLKVHLEQGDKAKAREALETIERICERYNYIYLLAISRAAQGDFYIEKADYQEAFRYYGETCHLLALYNKLRYNDFLKKMNDVLVNMPRSEIVKVTQSLITYWQEQHHEKDFPELIALCEDMRSLIV